MADSLAEMLGIGAHDAMQLLHDAGGDIQRAVTMHFSTQSTTKKPAQGSVQGSTESDVVELLEDDEDEVADLVPAQRANPTVRTSAAASTSAWRAKATTVTAEQTAGSKMQTEEKTRSAGSDTGLMRYFGSPSKPAALPVSGCQPASQPHAATVGLVPAPTAPTTASTTASTHRREQVAQKNDTQQPASSTEVVVDEEEDAQNSTRGTGTGSAHAPRLAGRPSNNIRANEGYRPVDSPMAWYDPIRHAAWDVGVDSAVGSAGGPYVHHPLPGTPPMLQASSTGRQATCAAAPYMHLSRAYTLIEPLTTRTRIYGCLVNMFRTLLACSPGETLPALLLSANMGGTLAVASTVGSAGPEGSAGEGTGDSRGESHVLTLGDSTLAAAICDVCGVKRDSLRSLFTQLGDLGDVAERYCSAQRTLVPSPPLTITGLYDSLLSIAKEKGPGCASRKQASIARLLRSAARVPGEAETRYVVRTLLQHLRIGVNLITALQCLARAVAFNEATGAVSSAAYSTPERHMCHGTGSSASAGGNQVEQKEGSAKSKSKKAPVVKRGVNALASSHTGSGVSAINRATGGWTGPHGGSQEGLPEPVRKHMEHAAAVMKRCYSVCPSVPVLVHSLLQYGVLALPSVCVPRVGMPLRPMLARITQGPQEALCKYQWVDEGEGGSGRSSSSSRGGLAFTAEWKYDGQRAQVHLLPLPPSASAKQGDRQVRICSRHLDDTTAKWPEVCRTLAVDVPAAWSARACGTENNTWRDVWTAALANCPALRAAVLQHGAQLDPLASQPSELSSVIMDAEVVAVQPLPSTSLDATTQGQTAQAGGPAIKAALQAGLLSAQGAHGGDPSLRILPFSVLATRSRATGAGDTRDGAFRGSAEDAAAGVSQQASTRTDPTVALYVFDLLSLNGVDLTHLPLQARRALMQAWVAPIPGRLAYAHALDILAQGDVPVPPFVSSAEAEPVNAPLLLQEALLEYLKIAVATGCEGLMCKLLAGNTQRDVAMDEDGEGEDDDCDDDDEVASVASSPALYPDSEVPQDAEGEGIGAQAPVKIHAGKCGRGAPVAPPPKRTKASVALHQGKAADKAPGPPRKQNNVTLLATYQPSARSNAWLKVKKDYVEGLADSFDLVVMGGWWGNGRKAGWFSPLLLGCWDPVSEMWQSLCRCMSGWTDVEYTALAQFYKDPANQLSPEEAAAVYHTDDPPAVWFRPCKVMELRGADLTLSPVHKAGQGSVHGSSRGVGLRFPRCLREREDKGPEDATSSSQIVEMYERQALAGHTGAGTGRPGKAAEEEEE